MWDNPIDLIIAALNSALEAAINGLAKGLRGIRILHKKLKLLFRVLLVTLLFLFPFLFFLFMGIKEEILWLAILFSALLSVYVVLIVRGFIKAAKKEIEANESTITNRLPFGLVALFTVLDMALISYWIATYNLGYNLIDAATFYLHNLRDQYSVSFLKLR